MILRDCVKMPCESCAVQFSVFRRKRACCECERYYCSGCLRRGGGAMCAPCRVLSTRPLSRQTIAHLKVRDLQCFLQRQNVSTRGCVEKEELVNLCVSHVNSTAYRRRGSRAGSSPFSTLKGFTNNINVLINSAFDLRSNPQPAPPPPHGNCYNSSHAHTTPPGGSPPHADPPAQPPRERFTTTPGGERDITVTVPEPQPQPERVRPPAAAPHSADCYEIEDVDEGWELVARPADPLPNDSEVLIADREIDPEQEDSSSSTARDSERSEEVREGRGRYLSLGGDTPARASSELELRPPRAASDSTSLQDEPLMDHDNVAGRKHITLEQLSHASDLDALNVKQLKELLARNRVEFRGCLERADLLERAKRLWREHDSYKDEIDKLPLEECCKICMAAPLECVLLECGHMAACTRCSTQLAECPICRQYVVRAVRVFRS
ncbi:LOW QUALITY PROTEIN: E3 ubiquitin-protein ligase RNF34 [Aphomia sociella]